MVASCINIVSSRIGGCDFRQLDGVYLLNAGHPIQRCYPLEKQGTNWICWDYVIDNDRQLHFLSHFTIKEVVFLVSCTMIEHGGYQQSRCAQLFRLDRKSTRLNSSH